MFPKIKTLMKHSENRIISQSGLFENDIEPGVLQVQQV